MGFLSDLMTGITTDSVRSALQIVAMPLLTALAWQGVALLRQHGYRTTYVEALTRALGTGEAAANARGTSMVRPDGRAIGFKAALDYMVQTVQPQATALGIDSDEAHLARLQGQFGAMGLQAAVNATTAAVAEVATASMDAAVLNEEQQQAARQAGLTRTNLVPGTLRTIPATDMPL